MREVSITMLNVTYKDRENTRKKKKNPVLMNRNAPNRQLREALMKRNNIYVFLYQLHYKVISVKEFFP